MKYWTSAPKERTVRSNIRTNRRTGGRCAPLNTLPFKSFRTKKLVRNIYLAKKSQHVNKGLVALTTSLYIPFNPFRIQFNSIVDQCQNWMRGCISINKLFPSPYFFSSTNIPKKSWNCNDKSTNKLIYCAYPNHWLFTADFSLFWEGCKKETDGVALSATLPEYH